MDISARIEQALEQAVALAQGPGAPPLLADALHYSVFPSGHRIRIGSGVKAVSLRLVLDALERR